MRSPSVTVVMITRNRRGEATAAVDALLGLPEEPQVVVVDNGSDDGTAEALRRRFPDVAVVPLPGNLGAAGRNVGVELASTPYVAFTDDDSGWRPGALAAACRLLDAHPGIGLMAGRVVVGSSGATDPVSLEMASSPLGTKPGLPGPSILGFVACGAVVRRDAFVEAGGFHRKLGVGGEEDLLALDLAARGWELVYVDGVEAVHSASETRDATERRTRLLRNDVWTSWLRRPAGAAVRRSARVLGRIGHDPRAVTGAVRAVAGLPWIVRERCVVPPEVEAALRKLGR